MLSYLLTLNATTEHVICNTSNFQPDCNEAELFKLNK